MRAKHATALKLWLGEKLVGRPLVRKGFAPRSRNIRKNSCRWVLNLMLISKHQN